MTFEFCLDEYLIGKDDIKIIPSDYKGIFKII